MSVNSKLKRAADNIRILAAAMVEKAKSGHPGGAMGGADFIALLYAEFLRYDPEQTDYPFRDRLFLDPGHMSPMLYSVLALAGNYTLEDLRRFRQWGSVTPGHPEADVLRGVENTSGPLGQGHAMGLGAALAERFLAARFGEWTAHKTYAYISDGGVEEEISQGVGRIAGHLGLSNFIMYYDANNVQLSTKVDEVDTENVAMKYEAWGWNVLSVDGHDFDAPRSPCGCGCREGAPDAHHRPHDDGQGGRGRRRHELRGQGFDPRAAAQRRRRRLRGYGPQPRRRSRKSVRRLRRVRRALRRAPHGSEGVAQGAGRKREEMACRQPRSGPQTRYVPFGPVARNRLQGHRDEGRPATWAASATMLGLFADKVENMVVASADLANSDKTDGFLKKTKAFAKGDFTGRFFQAGVSELTMACVMNGMALHGGVIPAAGTFFVFSDYMKPAVRLAALMRLHVIYIWSHDSFRVGEDGPTHQPVEHEAQIRLMEHLRNHKGERSMLVLRPADAEETVVAWKMALEEHRPVALILSRQNIRNLPTLGRSRREEAMQAAKGAYVVVDSAKPAVVMLASGSEVSTLVEGAELLSKEGINVRIVSVPSEGLFRDQPKSYQESVLPQGIVRYGMTSGLPVTLQGLVGENGTIHGLDHFGYSAPYKVLDEKFGYNGQTVCDEVKKLLGK